MLFKKSRFFKWISIVGFLLIQNTHVAEAPHEHRVNGVNDEEEKEEEEDDKDERDDNDDYDD